LKELYLLVVGIALWLELIQLIQLD